MGKDNETDGECTAQYQLVRENQDGIAHAIRTDPAAKKMLITCYKQKQWEFSDVDGSETVLINSALEKIKEDSSQFPEFVGMLYESGVRLIANGMVNAPRN